MTTSLKRQKADAVQARNLAVLMKKKDKKRLILQE